MRHGHGCARLQARPPGVAEGLCSQLCSVVAGLVRRSSDACCILCPVSSCGVWMVFGQVLIYGVLDVISKAVFGLILMSGASTGYEAI